MKYTDENTITIKWEMEITFSYDEIHQFVTENSGDNYTFSDVISELQQIRKLNHNEITPSMEYRFGEIDTVSNHGKWTKDKFYTIKAFGETENGRKIMGRLKQGE